MKNKAILLALLAAIGMTQSAQARDWDGHDRWFGHDNGLHRGWYMNHNNNFNNNWNWNWRRFQSNNDWRFRNNWQYRNDWRNRQYGSLRHHWY